jgi:hypothetical protein
LGIGWVLVAAILVMLPALRHGVSLGEYDWLSNYGILQQHGVQVHDAFAGDQINEMIPWTTLAWTQVHQGHLPLWNPYSALGMPLAFNWQSATFSLPNLLGYLFPLRLMFTVQVLTTLFIAGTGAYVLGRVLRLSVFACALAGTVFELSGPFFVWLGWPIASVVAWTGWLLAAVVLIVRGRHRIRHVALFAVAFAFAVFAGEPDTLVLLFITIVVFALVLLALRVRQTGLSATARPAGDLVLALVAGTFLGAPLLLPGLQLVSRSIRNTGGSALNAQKALSVRYLFRTAFPWLIGTPVVHEYKYIGIIAIVLALTGIAFRIRVPEVAALVGVTLVMGILVFVPVGIQVANALPGLHAVRLPRALNFFTFAVAMLAAVGLHVFMRSSDDRAGHRRVVTFVGSGFGLAGVALVGFWVTGWGRYSRLHIIRHRGLEWLLFAVVAGVVAVAVEVVVARYRRAHPPTDPARPGASTLLRRHGTGVWTGGLLVVVETIFLITSGTGLWSSSNAPFAPTPAVVALKQAVGSSLVALGSTSCFFPPGLGIPANANIAYGVYEFAVYDPLVPEAYFTAWKASTGEEGGQPQVSHFCPGVTSAGLAREFGVSYVLEPLGSLGPIGGVFDKKIGGELLYRIPGSSPATLTPLSPSGALPADDAAGVPIAVSRPGPASWRVETRSGTTQVLRLHLTDTPGWHATIDGRALALQNYNTIMLQAKIPPGRHVIELSYWPASFSEGIFLAVIAALALITAPFIAMIRRRRRTGPETPRQITTAE